MNRRVFKDEKTGREVWQVTDGEFECVAPYMDKSAWSREDRYLFYMSNRTGAWQPFRLTVETGEERQLAEVRNANFRSLVCEPKRGEVYVENVGTYLAVNVETLQQRVAFDYGRYLGRGPSQKGSAAALSGDGAHCVLAWRTAEDRPALIFGTTDGTHRADVVEFPRDDIAPGHELICPGDDRLLSFHGYPDRQNDAGETPDHRTAQWRLDRVTRAMKPLVLMPPGFRATHCLWGPSGDRFFFHKKTVPQWVPTALGSVNREGEDLRIHFETSQHRLGHSYPSPDEKWIVTDSQDPDANILMLASTERDEQRLLCWPNTSIGSKRPDKRLPHLPPHTDRHTHPGFSGTGRYVHYTSDVSGRSQVYVVPVGDIV